MQVAQEKKKRAKAIAFSSFFSEPRPFQIAGTP